MATERRRSATDDCAAGAALLGADPARVPRGHTLFSWLGGVEREGALLPGDGCVGDDDDGTPPPAGEEARARPADAMAGEGWWPHGHTGVSWGARRGPAPRRALAINKMGALYLRRGRVAPAVSAFAGAARLDPACAFAEANLAAALARARRWAAAEAAYRRALTTRPGFVGALCGLASLLLRGSGVAEAEEAARLCERALLASPGLAEAHNNLGVALRRAGRREEAVRRAWGALGQWPPPEVCPEALAAAAEQEGQEAAEPGLAVVCVKWGDKYNADYVNKLFRGVQRHLGRPARFVCFTDDPSGVEPPAETRPLAHGDLEGWWTKAGVLFGPELAVELGQSCRVIYLDLDTVICGSLEDLAAYRGPLAMLGTDSFAATEGRVGGLNSSIVLLRAGDAAVRPVLELLYRVGPESVRRLVHRLDFWLEMVAPGARVLQDLFPGQLVDFSTHVRDGAAPRGARVVNFPLRPKPHELPDHPLVREHWL